MDSKTYCPYPFSHIAIDTDGAKTLCCVSARHNKTIPPMDSRVNQPINDYWVHDFTMDELYMLKLK